MDSEVLFVLHRIEMREIKKTSSIYEVISTQSDL